MEMTKEVKTKIFAENIGQKVIIESDRFTTGGVKNRIEETIFGVNLEGTIICYHHEINVNDGIRLLKKPITSITDEDAIKISDIFGIENVSDKFKVEIIKQILRLDFKANDSFPFTWLSVYQFLQSKEYDLPHFLLGNKTLHEAGLAIYE